MESAYSKIAPQNFCNTELLYEYSRITKEEFYKKYDDTGWFARKVVCLFCAASSLIIKTTYHLSQATFAKLRKKNTAQAYFFKAKRDLIEAKGWFLTLFRDRLGQFYVQQSAYHKERYSMFIEGKAISSSKNDHSAPSNRSDYE